jgi:hypothetical protein
MEGDAMTAVSTQQWTQLINEKGIFHALRHLVATGRLTEKEAEEHLGQMFRRYAALVQEAQSEVTRLSAVLSRMSALCAANQRRQPLAKGLGAVDQLSMEVKAFDGWTISLYETDVTMIRLAAPERGKAMPQDFAASMNKLWNERVENNKFFHKNPGLFKLLF